MILQSHALRGAVRCNRTRVVANRCIFGQPKRQDHDDTAVDPGIARQPDTAVTRRIYFKDFSASGCREPFSLRQGRLDDLTTSRLGDGAHPNPKSPAKGSAKHPRDFCGTLPSPSVLFCARRSQRPSSTQFSIHSSLTESGSYKTGSQPRFALTPPGRPYKANVGGSSPSAPTKPFHHLPRTHLSDDDPR